MDQTLVFALAVGVVLYGLYSKRGKDKFDPLAVAHERGGDNWFADKYSALAAKRKIEVPGGTVSWPSAEPFATPTDSMKKWSANYDINGYNLRGPHDHIHPMRNKDIKIRPTAGPGLPRKFGDSFDDYRRFMTERMKIGTPDQFNILGTRNLFPEKVHGKFNKVGKIDFPDLFNPMKPVKKVNYPGRFGADRRVPFVRARPLSVASGVGTDLPL